MSIIKFLNITVCLYFFGSSAFAGTVSGLHTTSFQEVEITQIDITTSGNGFYALNIQTVNGDQTGGVWIGEEHKLSYSDASSLRKDLLMKETELRCKNPLQKSLLDYGRVNCEIGDVLF